MTINNCGYCYWEAVIERPITEIYLINKSLFNIKQGPSILSVIHHQEKTKWTKWTTDYWLMKLNIFNKSSKQMNELTKMNPTISAYIEYKEVHFYIKPNKWISFFSLYI